MKRKIDETPLGMSEEAAEIGTHHALPTTSISTIKFLLDMGSKREGIGDVEEIKGVRCRGHGVNLHFFRHVGFFHGGFPFQHLFSIFKPTAVDHIELFLRIQALEQK